MTVWSGRLRSRPSRAAAADGSRARLEREARIAARVNHPAVCQLFELGEDNGEQFIAMELLEGESLASRLARGALPVAEAIGIILGVLAGLEAAHRLGLVHRDVKPSNIFLTPHGAKLLDFGVAATISPLDVAATKLTLPGSVLGTPLYAAPEQLRGEAVDARSDLFSTAVVLYEMLAGQPPFAGSNQSWTSSTPSCTSSRRCWVARRRRQPRAAARAGEAARGALSRRRTRWRTTSGQRCR